MLGTQNLPLFITSAVLLNLTPGQDTMYILGRGVSPGRAAAVISALGISCGCMVHTLAAALGFSAVLATSAAAFQAVKWAGALYLIYLGLRMLTARRAPGASTAPPPAADRWTIYRQAVLTNLLNPKVALFFLAFLPQFVDPATTHRAISFLFLGACFIFTGTCWCLVLACASGAISRLLRRTGAAQAMDRLAGGLFVLLGVRLAIARPQ